MLALSQPQMLQSTAIIGFACGLVLPILPLPPPSSSRPASHVHRQPPPLATLEEPHARLILVRHGQSEWNRANRFTGWVDVDLTEQGISDAREAGKLLAAEGLEVDEVHTSLMRRAIRSAVLMLGTLNQCWIPVEKHMQLNEQHSGMLTGQNKRELATELARARTASSAFPARARRCAAVAAFTALSGASFVLAAAPLLRP